MTPQSLRLWSTYSGRMNAVDFVELRPQVDGRIEEIKFADGDMVEKGDVLFVIEPGPFEATLEEAKAALDAAQSQYSLADRELKRAQGLIKTEAISQKTLDERRNAAKVAKNVLDGAQALVDKAQINVDRAYVKAPISGRISRPEITVGNLVQTGAAPVLATIVSQDGIYADFEVDEQTYMQRIHLQEKGKDGEAGIPVELVLSDGSKRVGKIKSFDNHIDTSTGTIRARAYFGNKDGVLLPGMFVTVRLASPMESDVLLLTDEAIGTDQDRKFVYIVDEHGQTAYREITPGASVDGQRVILKGLAAGDKVVTGGLVKIRPGMPVVDQNTTAPAAGEEHAEAEHDAEEQAQGGEAE
ncbi:MAG: efflux RND transporter periplasmic adaptor subunit [Alphaproteobacteria bacterium]|nr:efflux RND transporter periplasmic adaptor subunit [Alphaproteobacteria bacterium]